MSDLGDYKRWQEDQRKARTAALPPVRSETLLAAANKLHNYLIHAPFCVHVPDDIWMPFDEALQEASASIERPMKPQEGR